MLKKVELKKEINPNYNPGIRTQGISERLYRLFLSMK